MWVYELTKGFLVLITLLCFMAACIVGGAVYVVGLVIRFFYDLVVDPR